MSIYLIDGTAYIYRAYHAIKELRNSRGFPTNAVYGFTVMLMKMLRQKKPAAAAVVFDTPEPTERHRLYAGYKAHRPSPPEDLIAQIPAVMEAVRALNVKTLTAPGWEADDVLATLALAARGVYGDVYIASSDKDMLQLLAPGVFLYDPVKEKVYDEGYVMERYALPPARFVEFQALTGDKADNVPGIDGVGEKTAVALLKSFNCLDELIANTDKIPNRRIRALVEANVESIRLSLRLVTLKTDAPLEVDVRELALAEPDTAELNAFFRKYEFYTLLRQLPERTDGLPERADGRAGGRTDVQAPPPDTLFPDGGDDAGLRPDCGNLKQCSGRDDWDDRNDRDGLNDRDEAAAGPSVQAVPPERAAEIIRQAVRSGQTSGAGVSIRPVAGPDGALMAVEIAFDPGTGVSAHVSVNVNDESFGDAAALIRDESVPKIGHDIKGAMNLLGRSGIEIKGRMFDTMIAAHLLNPNRADHGLEKVLAEHVPDVPCRAASAAAPDIITAPDILAAPDAITAPDIIAAPNPIAALTLTAARGLREKLEAAGLLKLYEDVEEPLVGVLYDMERRGVRLDGSILSGLSSEAGSQMEAIERRIYFLAGGEFNINSPKQLQEVLFERLSLKPARKIKTGYSTDVSVLEQLAERHPLPAEILRYRNLSKLKNTYLDALSARINPDTGRLHTTFNQTNTSTGRLSSAAPNLQNIPIRGPWGEKIRRAFTADPGCVLVSADYSQIELRILAHLSGDADLVEAFTNDRDVHACTAADVFCVPLSCVTPDMRRAAKSINFGIVYGMSVYGLAEVLKTSQAEAKKYMDAFFKTHAGVADYIAKTVEETKNRGFSVTIMGRTRAIPELSSGDKNTRPTGERLAVNTPVQGSAADVIKIAMIRLHEGLKRSFPAASMILQVHDELLVETPESDAEGVLAMVRREMENAVKLAVPLKVDVGVGKDWAAAHG